MMDNILEIAILEMGRQKGKDSFTCDEVIQWMYPQDWEKFTEEVRQTAKALEEKGKIHLSKNGEMTME